jgi:hypothetical protein
MNGKRGEKDCGQKRRKKRRILRRIFLHSHSSRWLVLSSSVLRARASRRASSFCGALFRACSSWICGKFGSPRSPRVELPPLVDPFSLLDKKCFWSLLASMPWWKDAKTGKDIKGDVDFAVATGHGHRWVGGFKRGAPHGRGKYVYRNGDSYEGDFADGRKDGLGTYVFADGDRYEGDFAKGQREGRGTLFHLADTPSKGARYEGQWKRGKKDGEGKYLFADGRRYEGAFKNDQYNGFGTMFHPDGRHWAGQWRDDKQVESGGRWFDADTPPENWSAASSSSSSAAPSKPSSTPEVNAFNTTVFPYMLFADASTTGFFSLCHLSYRSLHLAHLRR